MVDMDRVRFDQMIRGLDKAFPWVDLGLTLHKDAISINKIVVPEEMRKQGWGTLIMTTITGLADSYGLTITLTVDDVWGATSKNRLRKFYKRFGFVNNKGRNKDFTISDGMYRRPK